jgi:hypothetical protein
LGWHLIGGAGQLLDRSLVDRMVAYGERLCFEGAPLIEPPLAQDPAKRVPEAFEGEAIDTGLAVPPLSGYERHRLDEAKAVSAEGLGKARRRSDARQVLASNRRHLRRFVRRAWSRRSIGVSPAILELDFDHLGLVSVADVLANPDQFVGETLADPLKARNTDGGARPRSCRRTTAVVLQAAHGRAIYLSA